MANQSKTVAVKDLKVDKAKDVKGGRKKAAPAAPAAPAPMM